MGFTAFQMHMPKKCVNRRAKEMATPEKGMVLQFRPLCWFFDTHRKSKTHYQRWIDGHHQGGWWTWLCPQCQQCKSRRNRICMQLRFSLMYVVKGFGLRQGRKRSAFQFSGQRRSGKMQPVTAAWKYAHPMLFGWVKDWHQVWDDWLPGYSHINRWAELGQESLQPWLSLEQGQRCAKKAVHRHVSQVNILRSLPYETGIPG